jgi:KDO2-lipid IV(A) lauroyltransferase
MLTRLLIGLLWLTHLLPAGILARLGEGLGWLLFHLIRERREVTLTNLRLCFPEMPADERMAVAKRHFKLYGRTIAERSVLWWGSAARVRDLVRVEGLEHLRAQGARPVILMSMHFVGMEHGFIRLTLEIDMSAIYSRQKNPVFNRVMETRRVRFGHTEAFSRQDGIKAAMAAMLRGKPMAYLPDMDFGPKYAVFVPFFAMQAATITGLSKLAKTSGAAVVPVITTLENDRYVVRLHPAWKDFPTEDEVADTRRMNGFIEEHVRQHLDQYWWTHKRFKTRPPGEQKPY